MNITVESINRRDEESLIVKIQEALAWVNEIVYMLDKQLKSADEIKYYDWSWNYSSPLNSSSMSLCSNKGLNNLNQSKVTNEA